MLFKFFYSLSYYASSIPEDNNRIANQHKLSWLSPFDTIKLFTGFVQQVVDMAFERKLIINSNTQSFLPTAGNINTIDINFKVTRGYDCRSFFSLTRSSIFLGWLSFRFFKQCKHITRPFLQPFNNFTRCFLRHIVYCHLHNLQLQCD